MLPAMNLNWKTKLRRFLINKRRTNVLLVAWLPYLTVAMPLLGQNILDDGELNVAWESHRDMSESAYETKLEALKTKGFRPVDMEIMGGETRSYTVLWRKNTDGRVWEVRSRLEDSEYSAKWQELRNKGLRPIDQEHHAIGSKQYYGAIWIENKENLDWQSFRRLSGQEFIAKYDQYKSGYLPIDVDAYTLDGQLRYAVIWVENRDKWVWAMQRDQPMSDWDAAVADWAAKGYRPLDVSIYWHNNTQYFATIWVKEASRGFRLVHGLEGTAFRNHWFRQRDAGYRLTDIEWYQTPEGPRFAAVWAKNAPQRADWPLSSEIDLLIATYLQDHPSVGLSCAISVGGVVRYQKGWGFQDLSTQKEAHAETIYRCASISKAITSTLAFWLAAQKRLDLSKRVCDYEPKLPAHLGDIKLGQLLSNRGRVHHYRPNDPLGAGAPEHYTSAFDACRLFASDPLVDKPYLYSTHGYTVFAAALEKAIGKPFPDILESELSSPFGLRSVQCEDLTKDPLERSKLYTLMQGPTPQVLSPLSLSWKYAGGGMEAHVLDLVRFGNLLLSGAILTSPDLHAMMTPPDTLASYAYGWSVSGESKNKTWYKSGDQPGARAFIRCYPGTRTVVAILCNTRGKGLDVLSQQIAVVAQR